MKTLTLALMAAALAGGCSKHQTEMILVITTEGVRIPEDVHKVHLTVADRQASLDDTVYDADVELCTPSLSTACYNIPVTAALFPGKAHGSDSVRVQVDAIGAGGIVIADAALFTFADEQSLRLDFVLYGNCLGNVECAKRDQACGPLDTCIDLKPGSANGGLDIALPRGPEDLSMPLPADMTNVDLAGADFTLVPADLVSTLDLAGCASVTCDMGEQCIAGTCQPCGFPGGDPCCFSGSTGTCYPTNTVCSGGYCVNCGNENDPCCTQQSPACNGNLLCDQSGTCVQPPDMSIPNDMSLMPSDMMVSGSADLF